MLWEVRQGELGIRYRSNVNEHGNALEQRWLDVQATMSSSIKTSAPVTFSVLAPSRLPIRITASIMGHQWYAFFEARGKSDFLKSATSTKVSGTPQLSLKTSVLAFIRPDMAEKAARQSYAVQLG